MPHFDGTGPRGRGRQFGRGNGNGNGAGAGAGCGFGYGRRQRNRGQAGNGIAAETCQRRSIVWSTMSALRTEIQALREQLDTLMSRSGQ